MRKKRLGIGIEIILEQNYLGDEIDIGKSSEMSGTQTKITD